MSRRCLRRLIVPKTSILLVDAKYAQIKTEFSLLNHKLLVKHLKQEHALWLQSSHRDLFSVSLLRVTKKVEKKYIKDRFDYYCYNSVRGNEQDSSMDFRQLYWIKKCLIESGIQEAQKIKVAFLDTQKQCYETRLITRIYERIKLSRKIKLESAFNAWKSQNNHYLKIDCGLRIIGKIFKYKENLNQEFQILKRNAKILDPERENIILEHIAQKQKSRIFSTMKYYLRSTSFTKLLLRLRTFHSLKENYLLSKSFESQDVYLASTKKACQIAFKHLLLAHLHTNTLKSLTISTRKELPKELLAAKIEELNTKIMKRSLRNILAVEQPSEENSENTSVVLTSLVPKTLRFYFHKWRSTFTVDSYRNPQMRHLLKNMKRKGFSRFIVMVQLREYSLLCTTHKELLSTHKVCARALEISRCEVSSIKADLRVEGAKKLVKLASFKQNKKLLLVLKKWKRFTPTRSLMMKLLLKAVKNAERSLKKEALRRWLWKKKRVSLLRIRRWYRNRVMRQCLRNWREVITRGKDQTKKLMVLKILQRKRTWILKSQFQKWKRSYCLSKTLTNDCKYETLKVENQSLSEVHQCKGKVFCELYEERQKICENIDSIMVRKASMLVQSLRNSTLRPAFERIRNASLYRTHYWIEDHQYKKQIIKKFKKLLGNKVLQKIRKPFYVWKQCTQINKIQKPLKH
ncbi:unnamed protein product [Moneuplotes crassus]|uniref:Uncharacterized protein n=1 Tax=Euplotes crassus TaxID=5936 RepID=A0AAD1Y9Y3_EUPCR|nr:unnamed protein product [Moneuplotes crassus]